MLNKIVQSIPNELKNTKFTYIEPFIGGGTVLFHILDNYKNIEKAVINDINTDLINT